MEAAAGYRLRACGLTHVGQRHQRGIRRGPVLLNVPRKLQRTPQTAASPGPGSSSSDDSLAPIIFRFSDATPSPAVSTSSGTTPAQNSSWTGIISPSGINSSAASSSGAGSTATAAVASASPSTNIIIPLDAAPRVGSSGVSSGASVSTPGPSRSSHDATTHADSAALPPSAAPDAISSYSNYYRKINTTFQHPHSTASELAPPVNGWTKAASSSAPSHAPAVTPDPADGALDDDIRPSAAAARGAPAEAPTDATTATTSTTTTGQPQPAVGAGNGTHAPAAASAAAAAVSDPAEVNAALARAQAALTRAETSLDDIQRLSSSLDAAALESLRVAPPSRWSRLLAFARGAAVFAGLSFAMLASHAFGLAVQWAGAAVGAALIAGWGLRRGSLAPSGAVAAFVVGCGTLGSSLRFGATLIGFFLSSSKLTSYKEELKEGLEENAKKGGQRSWVQVLCNGLVPTILAVVYGVLAGCVDLPLGPPAAAAATAVASGPALEPWRAAVLTGLMGGFLGYYACCCGDTWASELGPLSADTPRLITTLRPVRRGTNGGVTLLGLSASIMGGMFVGLVFYLAGLLSPTLWIFESQRSLAAGQWRLIPLGLMAGLLGSVLDSVLGATLQYSGYDRRTGRIVSRPGPDVTHIAGVRLLDNNAVNAVSATATSALTAFMAMKTFGF